MAAYYTFEDLSGANTPVTGDNPYQDLIAACHDDPVSCCRSRHCWADGTDYDLDSNTSSLQYTSEKSKRPTEKQNTGSRLSRRDHRRDIG